jgi:hypothetical protein
VTGEIALILADGDGDGFGGGGGLIGLIAVVLLLYWLFNR